MWKIEFYQETKSKQYRWRMRNAANGRIVADSAEAYVTRHGVLRALMPLATALKATVWEAFSDGRRARQYSPAPNVVPMFPIHQRQADDTPDDGRFR